VFTGLPAILVASPGLFRPYPPARKCMIAAAGCRGIVLTFQSVCIPYGVRSRGVIMISERLYH
jgi:hypothetical protein